MAGAPGDVESPGLAQRLATAALAVPGVSGLHSGVFGEVATYLPGERVSGVSLDDDAGAIHIVVDVSHDLHGVAAQVRDAAEEIAARPITVTIADISVGTPAEEGETE
ncbi:hypothetical protein [Gordonia sp. 'Campus']|uniref:hypothetical protein n=1 Tax=Gordonia sp. 'Campus' TaxID=2915824 RepID=UPI001EE484EC|nr:hypothetical protein [Gordonia sp. 'Campus']